MPSINLGLANKVKKSYQGIDLDKKREETIEDIGHSYVKTISWASFINKLLTFCDEHNIKILKKYEDSESGCMKFHSKSIDILPSGLKFNSKPTDVLPNSISFYIISRTEETKNPQRYDYYTSKSFTKQNNTTYKKCYLFINKIAREVNGEKREGLTVYIQYSKRTPDGFNDVSLKGVVLSNSPVIDIETSLKSGYATRGGNLNTPPSSIGWLLCENTVKDLFDLISELKTISAIAEEKYKTTRLAESSIFNLISKNLSDKFKPIVINGRHELKYKYWDTLIESSTALGLSKKVKDKHTSQDYNKVIKDMILDEKSFIKYVTDFIEKWQEENSASAIPQIKDFVHPAPGLRTVFAEKNNASCSVFNVDAKSISRSIIVYVGQEGSEHSGEFSLFMSSNAWGVFYRTTDSQKITGSYPVWLSMTIENFEHVFNWIQTQAPDADDSMNESMSSRLGLAKKVGKHYQEKNIEDTIENISVLDKPEFFKMCEQIFSSENSKYIVDSKKGIYDSKNDWDFWYVHRKGNDKYPKTAYIRVDGTKQGYMFTFYMNSPFSIGNIEYPIGRLNSSFDICNDMVDENVSKFEIWDCLNAMRHIDMTVSNLLKAKDFFEKCCRGDILNEWVNKEYVVSYVKKWFSLKESNISLGLSNKVKKEYSKRDSNEAVSKIGEMSLINFRTALEVKLRDLGPALEKQTTNMTSHLRWYPEDPIKRETDHYQWVSLLFGDRRFTFFLVSEYKASTDSDIVEDVFRVEYVCWGCGEFTEYFIDGENPLSNQQNKSFPNFKMTYDNLEKAIEWMKRIFMETLPPWQRRHTHKPSKTITKENKGLSLEESNTSLGLSNKVKREFSKKDSDESVIELSEMSFMEFYNALKNKLEVLGRAWQRDTKGITQMSWWPKDFEDPDKRDQRTRDHQWIRMSFEGVGRFVFKMFSQYQIYPKYKNLAEDTFKASYTYSEQPSENVYINRDVIFLSGDNPIQDPDIQGSDAYKYPFFKMTYGNLDKVIQWVSSEIRKPRNSTDLKRLVQMS